MNKKITIELYDSKTDALTNVDFLLGDYVAPVKNYGAAVQSAGYIVGISLAKKQVKIKGRFANEGVWHDVGSIQKLEKPEVFTAKKEPLSKVIAKMNKKQGFQDLPCVVI